MTSSQSKASSSSQARGKKRKKGGGRKQSAEKAEDLKLYQAIVDGSNVLRSKRQEDILAMMQRGINISIFTIYF